MKIIIGLAAILILGCTNTPPPQNQKKLDETAIEKYRNSNDKAQKRSAQKNKNSVTLGQSDHNSRSGSDPENDVPGEMRKDEPNSTPDVPRTFDPAASEAAGGGEGDFESGAGEGGMDYESTGAPPSPE